MSKDHGHRPSDERRDYFRVADKVLLRILPVPASARQSKAAADWFRNGSQPLQLLQELRSIDAENHTVMRAVSELSRDLELYLKNLNRKIDMLAHALVEGNESLKDQRPVSVTLSEAGFAFAAKGHKLTRGSWLAVQLTLLPSYAVIFCYAAVLSLRDDEVAVEFANLTEADRQLLARHILQVQIAERKRSQT
ncbi:MAG TPA: PilZ domain-containing protein [Spongiibacteraceae bacterium]|nr:PilZ domain-containing protein [Spongiibacteraceae bacterium]HUH37597.1 PilZ domain-containing protein [Spongiibacteraceae bacterium]